MLDIKFIRQNPDKVEQGCQKKGVKVDIDKLLDLDKKRRKFLQEIEQLRTEQKKFGKKDIEKATEIKFKIKKTEPELAGIEKEFQDLMLQVPNLPLEDVPIGKNEGDNVIVKKWGKTPKFTFQPKDYLEISQNLDLIDVKRAAKVSGTRFGYLKKEAVLLEFALINLTFDVLIKQGFSPILPPVMIRPEMMGGMGYIKKTQNAKCKMQNYEGEEVYFLRDDNLVLTGTSEQSIGPMHTDEVFSEEELPKRYVGFSTCFRREAGAYGKDTKGILRVHQFDKIEMFSFCHPEKSEKEHQFFLKLEEKLIQLLEIPYRVVQMCAGDLGNPAAAKCDIEAWIPGQSQYRETHSTSNCTDYQARRLNIRYKTKEGKLGFVHTINGTAFAIGRIIIAIIENYQRKDGRVDVPKILQKYLGFKVIPKK